MQMPGRTYRQDSSAYRYGFNGKENDNDVKGEGNQQDYGMRIYDPRVGRFSSVDRLQAQYPGLTCYQFASNSPVAHIDLDGLEKYHYTYSFNDKGDPQIKLTKTEHFSEWQWNPRKGGTSLGFQLWQKVQDPRKEYYVDFAYKTYAVTDVLAVEYMEHVSVKYNSDPSASGIDNISGDLDNEIKSVSNWNAFRQGLAAGLSKGSRPSIPRLSRSKGAFGTTPNSAVNEQSTAAMNGNSSAAQANTAPAIGSLNVPRRVLYHYTTEEGQNAILSSKTLNASLKENNPSDARYGDGQYLSDIAPGTKTPAQLSRAFLNIPYQGKRFTNFIAIDVTGLNVVRGRDGVFVIPNSNGLNLQNRIVGSGRVQASSQTATPR